MMSQPIDYLEDYSDCSEDFDFYWDSDYEASLCGVKEENKQLEAENARLRGEVARLEKLTSSSSESSMTMIELIDHELLTGDHTVLSLSRHAKAKSMQNHTVWSSVKTPDNVSPPRSDKSNSTRRSEMSKPIKKVWIEKGGDKQVVSNSSTVKSEANRQPTKTHRVISNNLHMKSNGERKKQIWVEKSKVEEFKINLNAQKRQSTASNPKSVNHQSSGNNDHIRRFDDIQRKNQAWMHKEKYMGKKPIERNYNLQRSTQKKNRFVPMEHESRLTNLERPTQYCYNKQGNNSSFSAYNYNNNRPPKFESDANDSNWRVNPYYY